MLYRIVVAFVAIIRLIGRHSSNSWEPLAPRQVTVSITVGTACTDIFSQRKVNVCRLTFNFKFICFIIN